MSKQLFYKSKYLEEQNEMLTSIIDNIMTKDGGGEVKRDCNWPRYMKFYLEVESDHPVEISEEQYNWLKKRYPDN